MPDTPLKSNMEPHRNGWNQKVAFLCILGIHVRFQVGTNTESIAA